MIFFFVRFFCFLSFFLEKYFGIQNFLTGLILRSLVYRVQVSLSMKWSSVVLAADMGIATKLPPNDDIGGPKSVSCPEPWPCPVESTLTSHSDGEGVGVGDDGGGSRPGRGVRRTCLPIHLGRLSCLAEAGVSVSEQSVEVKYFDECLSCLVQLISFYIFIICVRIFY